MIEEEEGDDTDEGRENKDRIGKFICLVKDEVKSLGSIFHK